MTTRVSRRSSLLTGVLLVPASLCYLLLLVAPIVIVVVFSFGFRGKTGGYAGGFTTDNYADLSPTNIDPFITSLRLSVVGTILCLLVGLPLAYFIATRAGQRKGLFIVLLVIPFWTSFLIRTYAWLIDPRPGRVRRLLGRRASATRRSGSSAREWAVQLGLVYGYLPLMVFPLYVTLERMDRVARRGVEGPRRRPLGDVPPDHAADRPARA